MSSCGSSLTFRSNLLPPFSESKSSPKPSKRLARNTTITLYVGFEVFTVVVMKSISFWDITPCSPFRGQRLFGGTYRLHLQGGRNNFSKQAACSSRCHLLACWFLAEIISSSLKMEATCSSETSVDTQRTTRRYIPEFATNHSLWSMFATCLLVLFDLDDGNITFLRNFGKLVPWYTASHPRR
jgi:hypothetical protein